MTARSSLKLRTTISTQDYPLLTTLKRLKTNSRKANNSELSWAMATRSDIKTSRRFLNSSTRATKRPLMLILALKWSNTHQMSVVPTALPLSKALQLSKLRTIWNMLLRKETLQRLRLQKCLKNKLEGNPSLFYEKRLKQQNPRLTRMKVMIDYLLLLKLRKTWGMIMRDVELLQEWILLKLLRWDPILEWWLTRQWSRLRTLCTSPKQEGPHA